MPAGTMEMLEARRRRVDLFATSSCPSVTAMSIIRCMSAAGTTAQIPGTIAPSPLPQTVPEVPRPEISADSGTAPAAESQISAYGGGPEVTTAAALISSPSMTGRNAFLTRPDNP